MVFIDKRRQSARGDTLSFVSARTESWPYARYHRRLFLIGGLGYAFDAMDTAVLAFILPILRSQWALSSAQTGVLASVAYVGFFFGALGAGMFGDMFGRRRVMMYALAIYAMASLASALVSNWPAFLVLRIVAGIGTGAESAIIAPYLAEFVARRYRGTFVGALTGFFSFGFVAAAALGYFVVRSSAEGWRIVLVITALPVGMLLWWRRSLDESPRWLESRGRHDEARAIIARIEAGFGEPAAADVPADDVATSALPVEAPQASAQALLRGLWQGRQARITAMSWLMWLSLTFSYYLFFTWIPGLLMQKGMGVTQSFGYSFLIYLAQIPGYFSAALLNEKIGRKATIVLYMAMGTVFALAMAFAHSHQAILLAGACLSFAMNGAYAGVYAYTAEIFPTAIRAFGAGTSSAVGRIGAISAPLLVGLLYPVLGFGGVFAMTTAVLAMGVGAVIVLGPQTTGLSLEAITAEEGQP